MRCWGDNQWGQLGDGSTETVWPPVEVSGIKNAVSVSAGGKHSCALLEGGSVSCWGFNGDDQLGNSSVPDRWSCSEFRCAQSNYPVLVEDVSGAKQISVGEDHTCALLNGGGIKCWGYNFDGQLGNESVPTRHTCGEPCDGSLLSSPAVSVTGISAATQVSAGLSHTCALVGGRLECWGANWFGQLGNGSTDNWTPTPTKVSGIDDATSVSAGVGHTCTLLASASVKCWGTALSGEIGSGTITQSAVPMDVLEAGVSGLDTGSSFTCAVRIVRRISCWGLTNSGRLGDGPDPISPSFLLPGIPDANSLSSGGSHSCVLTSEGAPLCWGANNVGQLGDRSVPKEVFLPVLVPDRAGKPVAVVGLGPLAGQGPIRGISSGGSHSCALTQDAAVYCWGANWSGQLGTGTVSDHDPPNGIFGFADQPVRSRIADVESIEVGSDYSCAITITDDLYCWGSNDYQMGSSPLPVKVQGVQGVVSVAIGSNHACLIAHNTTLERTGPFSSSGGKVYCWGDNTYGQLGTPSPFDSDSPTEVLAVQNAIAITAGEAHTCALITGGTAMCWGRNDFGQLGRECPIKDTDGVLIPECNSWQDPFPGEISGLPPLRSISAGALHTCSITEDERVFCWGNNKNGELGKEGGTPRRCASAGDGFICTGELSKCNGEHSCISTPAHVTRLANVEQLEAGGVHSCFVLVDGTVGCWGSNEEHQLGNDLSPTILGTRLERRDWEYVGPTLLSPCDDTARDHSAGLCWENIEAGSSKLSVNIQQAHEGAQSLDLLVLGKLSGELPQTPSQVAGLATFFDRSGKPIATKPFCARGRFPIPSGTRDIGIELYEGAADAPVSLQRACRISAPISGSVTLVLTSSA